MHLLFRVVQYCIACFYNIPIKFTLYCSFMLLFLNEWLFCECFLFSLLFFCCYHLHCLCSTSPFKSHNLRRKNIKITAAHSGRSSRLNMWYCVFQPRRIGFPEQIHSSSLTPSFTHLRVGIWLSCAAGLRIIFKVHATNKITNIISTKSYRRNTHNNEQTNNAKY